LFTSLPEMLLDAVFKEISEARPLFSYICTQENMI
jgi:hypothetical protein